LFPIADGKTFVLPFRVKFPTEHLKTSSSDVLNEYTLPNRFFLVCNLFAPTKNHIVIFEALKRLQDDGLFPTLVCTGDLHDYRNPKFANTILRSINQNGVSQQVRLLGVIPRHQQIQLMRHSVAVIQPSLFEGWNTGVEEAHCLGKTLILSDIPVHREQNPPDAFLFDPQSPSDLAKALRAAWEQTPGGIQEGREVTAVESYQELVSDFANMFLTLASLPPSTTTRGTEISAN
jgi:glycosyltransferase involved in cell wall biosynthesis